MPQIIPIRDLKNTAKISELCHQTDEPVFITKNGYGDMVLMSMKAYEEKMLMLDVYARIAEAEEEVRKGKTLYKLEITVSARNDLEKIYEYIAFELKNLTAAGDFLSKMEKCCDLLVGQPYMYDPAVMNVFEWTDTVGQ